MLCTDWRQTRGGEIEWTIRQSSPLPDDEWAKGKCGLKGLQYMALEIPTLMSPVGVNTEIINSGENGYLHQNEGQWFDML